MDPVRQGAERPPIVAVVASAIRAEEWPSLHDQLAQTSSTPFVMVFAGHVPPHHPLPHLQHLYVEESQPPSLSIELAYRFAHGIASVEFILNLTDDAIIPGGMLDFLVARQREHPDDDVITGAAFAARPDLPLMPLRYHEGDSNSPALTVFAMMKKSTSLKIGGIDRRFHGLYWDCDRVMRLYALGGQVINYDAIVTSEKALPPLPNNRLSDRCSSVDRALLDWLWTVDRKGGECSPVRLDPVLPFA